MRHIDMGSGLRVARRPVTQVSCAKEIREFEK
jgi:hypothetical protein